MSEPATVEKLRINAKELGAMLGLCERTIRTMDYAGDLPKPGKLGRKVLWSLAEIRAWEAAGMPNRQRWEQIKAANPRGRSA